MDEEFGLVSVRRRMVGGDSGDIPRRKNRLIPEAKGVSQHCDDKHESIKKI